MMQLQLRPSSENQYPLLALLVKGKSPTAWLKAIEELELQIDTLQAYALPGLVPNSVWGCLLITNREVQVDNHRYEVCQLAFDALFLPSYTELFPAIDYEDSQVLFRSELHFMHPEIGLVVLQEPLYWGELLEFSQVDPPQYIQPVDGILMYDQIRSFQVIQLPPKDVITELENSVRGNQKHFENRSLSFWEQVKLSFYEKVMFRNLKDNFQKTNSNLESSQKEQQQESSFFRRVKKTLKRMQGDFKSLEERNQKEVDKLLGLMKNDPAEALKYAIPLDDKGAQRGGARSERFQMAKRWGDFSIWSNSSRVKGIGLGIDVGDKYSELKQSYQDMAKQFEQNGDHKHSAFVYMKLLQDPHEAGKVLEIGKYYNDAANVFLEKCDNKYDAARCFELAKNYDQAVKLFVELNDHEKAGDMFVLQGKKNRANEHYEQVVVDHLKNNDHVKAANIYKHKIGDSDKGQTTLLAGWRDRPEMYHCLHLFFQGVSDEQELWEQMQLLRQEDVNAQNCIGFLKAVKGQYLERQKISGSIQQMVYELIARYGKGNQGLLPILNDFSPHDSELRKDINRFMR